MHELGIMINIVKTVENIAKENGVTEIQKLVLQIGELSTVVPRFVRACYPAAVDGTMLETTELEIEILPGNAICNSCSKVFNLVEYDGKCPDCQEENYEILGGKDFLIKEILAC